MQKSQTKTNKIFENTNQRCAAMHDGMTRSLALQQFEDNAAIFRQLWPFVAYVCMSWFHKFHQQACIRIKLF